MEENYQDVWVFSELPQLVFELLGKGTTLAKDLTSELVAISIGNAGESEDYIKRGADKVIKVENPSLDDFQITV